MSLPKDYVTELNALNKEILRQQPADVLQFCANYFLGRLEEQRKHQWQLEPQARTMGISLFPQRGSTSSSAVTPATAQAGADDQPLFKQPFGDNDPHTRADDEDPGAAGLFKSDFDVGSSVGGPIGSTIDPMASEPQLRRTSVTTQQPVNIPSSFNANRRTSVSAETLNPHGIHDDWKAPVIPKSAEQLSRLSVAVAKNFLFSALDADSLSTVIDALKEVKLPSGSEVIRQGDEGDFFYVLEDGNVRFLVNGSEVSSSGPGSSFGELALMYNSPRAATALAQTDVTLWALDRLTFRKILLAKTSKKRQMYESFLREVPVLSRLSAYERSKLADALETESYKPGDVIIKEGEIGENFYLIEKGEANVVKDAEGVVNELKRGDYFGEVALLNDTPRQASVVATTAVDVATLDKRGFQRLLGPAVEVLKRQDPTKN